MLSMYKKLGWCDHPLLYRFRSYFSIWVCFLSGIHLMWLCYTIYASLVIYPLFLMTFGYPITNTYGCYFLSIILIYTIYWIRDINTPDSGGRRCSWLRSLSLFQWASQYFPVRLLVSEELRVWGEENGQYVTENGESFLLPNSFNYLLGYHPHGAYAIGASMAFGTESLNFSKIFPRITPYAATASGFYNIPFFRELLMACGGVSVSRESLVYLLDTGKTGTSGNLVAVVVGGAREVLESRPGRYVLVFSRRRGFFRLALQTGCHLVPSIGFGETYVFDQVANPEGSRRRKLEDWILDKFGLPPIFYCPYRTIPNRRPITVVVGRPIVCERIANPTDEQVDELREKYKQQLFNMFNKYRPLYDPTAEDIQFT